MNTHDSVTAANYLRAYAYDKGVNLNVTQVQKLLFLAYGIGLAKFKTKLVGEEPKAWPYGPVFPRARKNFDTAPKLSDSALGDIKQDSDAVSILSARDNLFPVCQIILIKTTLYNKLLS